MENQVKSHCKPVKLSMGDLRSRRACKVDGSIQAVKGNGYGKKQVNHTARRCKLKDGGTVRSEIENSKFPWEHLRATRVVAKGLVCVCLCLCVCVDMCL